MSNSSNKTESHAKEAKGPKHSSPPLRLRDLPPHERPQERLENLGASALSDRELVAMLVRSGNARMDVLAIADALLARAGSLAGLLRWDVEDFRQVPGIGPVKALQLSTYTEVAKRMSRSNRSSCPKLSEPLAVFTHLYPEVRSDNVEKVWVLCLDRKNKLIRMESVTSGTATGSLVHPREIFRPAIRHGATAVIVAHNHPSGDPTPSKADLTITRKLRESAEHLDIELHDHIIIGEPEDDPRGLGFYSFAEAGVL
ncbi:MAG: DNA repair protein RadC [Verrucomicrobia bacterium]|jgi:DNA repair protein RadC|nr:DNA repair protein RadC [Verrucomicrobiota bacterium]MDA1046078.1 DNA repair protein RadC [Verrucomicrobiota bacterium]